MYKKTRMLKTNLIKTNKLAEKIVDWKGRLSAFRVEMRRRLILASTPFCVKASNRRRVRNPTCDAKVSVGDFCRWSDVVVDVSFVWLKKDFLRSLERLNGINFIKYLAVVVAQLVERLLPTPEIRGLNPNIGILYLPIVHWIRKYENREIEAGNNPLKKSSI